MRIINKDLTQESITLSVSNNQIYARIWSRTNNKWSVDEYFKAFSFEVDSELIESSIREIIRTWGLKAPKIIVIK